MCFPKVLEQGSKQLLAVIIPGSPQRPHFAGQAYVRVGSETKKASDEQFAKLIAERNSKACKILEWKGKKISVKSSGRVTLAGVSFHEGAVEEFTVVDCDQFYVTLGKLISVPQGAAPLEAVAVSFDYPNKRLELVVREV